MDCVHIGSYLAADSLRRRLFGELDVMRAQGLDVSVQIRTLGGLTLLECTARSRADRFLSDQEFRCTFRRRLAAVVARLIFEELEKSFILETLSNRHPEIDDDEAREVASYAVAILNDGIFGMLEPSIRLGEVAADIESYLRDSSLLVIEGFVRFRMREYLDELRSSTEEALGKFVAERERKEFVKLLKYFVDVQEDREDEVHVVRGSGKGFDIRSPGGRPIEGDYVASLAADLLGEGVEVVDLLISALITVAPRKVVLHFEPEMDVAETLESVFEGRVSRCSNPECGFAGCELRMPHPAGNDPVEPVRRR
ncbi:MAG: putative sporulation protein YtxC [Bacillota bacterium]|jgi:putative sporulation protein YtxC